MNRQRSAVLALVAVALSLGLSYPSFAQEDAKPASDKKDAAASTNSGDTITIKEKMGKGVGREGNWKIQAQGSPSIEDAKKKVEANPKSADAHNDLGWALRQHDKLEDAEKELRAAIELDDTLAYAHSNLSVVLLDKDRIDDAVKEAERAVALDEKAPIYRVVYGNALCKQKKLDEAVKQYSEAVALRSDYENALYNLGRVLHMQGKNAQAIAVLSQAEKLDPTDHRVRHLLDKLE